jgi:hypothetical protein
MSAQLETRVARFFLVQHTKTGENVPNDHTYVKYTTWPQNIPHGHKIYQMVVKREQIGIKCIDIFHCKILQNLPKFGFLF